MNIQIKLKSIQKPFKIFTRCVKTTLIAFVIMTKKIQNGKSKSAKVNSTSLKKLKFGVEFELFTLDQEGQIISGSERLIKKINDTFPNIKIEKECGKNMIEINSFPDTNIPNAIEKTLEDFESILHCAEKENIVLYSYGTHPGTFTPEIHESKGYQIKEQIFGKQRFSIAARCIGLHCHFSLPWGVFDYANKIIKDLINSKNQQSMINLYNLFIAMDPALTTFAQSSPFYQGKYLGKDSRVIVYRGGEIFNYPQGLYSNYQKFGALQPYKYTEWDLIQIIKNRFDNWKTIIKKIDVNLRVFLKRGSILDTAWNPVKISSHGTIEQRGMDINHPRVIISLATLIEHISREVQENYLQVIPSNIGIDEPFKREDNKIYIPPHTRVRFELQPKSAYDGLENDDIYNYCTGLLKLGKTCMPKESLSLMEPIEKMLKERKTVSDEILEEAKKMGIDTKEKMTNNQAAELALKLSEGLFKEIIMTKQAIKNLNN